MPTCLAPELTSLSINSARFKPYSWKPVHKSGRTGRSHQERSRNKWEGYAGLVATFSSVPKMRPSDCADQVGDDLTPTESWSDSSQNCLHDMGIVGNTKLVRDG